MILEKFNLSGKVAIVTGTSTGLGQGMAIGLAEAGADIVGVDYVETLFYGQIEFHLGVALHIYESILGDVSI